MSRSVLLCGATRAELDAAARGAPAFATLLTGVGPEHARRALSDYLTRERPALVVSTGFAGALGGVDVGTWVTATRIDGVEVELRTGPAVGVELTEASALVTAPRGEGGVVDMESAALARVAQSHDLPLMVLRLVSDSPDHPLPAFLAPFTDAMSATRKRDWALGALRGVRGALADPRGVARLVRDGRQWTKELETGWRRFAPEVAKQAR